LVRDWGATGAGRRDVPHTELPEIAAARVEALDRRLRRPAERRRQERIGIALR
jgi:hypothetical protein